MSSHDPSQPPSSQPPKDAAKAVGNSSQPTQLSPSLRWLDSCSQLFKAAEKDSKDVLCMVEVLQDRVLRSDVVLSEMEKILLQKVHEFMEKQAQYIENVFAGDLALVKAIREADSVNSIVSSQLESSQMMSRQLLQRITGIIEAPATVRTPNSTKNGGEP